MRGASSVPQQGLNRNPRAGGVNPQPARGNRLRRGGGTAPPRAQLEVAVAAAARSRHASWTGIAAQPRAPSSGVDHRKGLPVGRTPGPPGGTATRRPVDTPTSPPTPPSPAVVRLPTLLLRSGTTRSKTSCSRSSTSCSGPTAEVSSLRGNRRSATGISTPSDPAATLSLWLDTTLESSVPTAEAKAAREKAAVRRVDESVRLSGRPVTA